MTRRHYKLFAFILFLAVLLCIVICFANKNYDYSIASYTNTFSAWNDRVCWTTYDNLFIEKESIINSSSDYGLQNGQYYDNPTLVGNNLYFVGGVNSSYPQEVYIARINYNGEKPKLEKLTENKKQILLYTICGDKLYYVADGGLYIKNLLTQKEEFFTEYRVGESFCTNGKRLIIGNTVYDIKSKKSEKIIEESVMALGIIDHYYYCFNFSDTGHDLICIDLVDNSIKTLCQIPYGWGFPKMSGDKILFTTSSVGSVNVGYCYYDISKDIIVTVIDAEDSQDRYIYYPDHMEYYDYILYDNTYYFHYPDMVTRMNIETKTEELFCSVRTLMENGHYMYKHRWLTYDEYLQELNNGNLWQASN